MSFHTWFALSLCDSRINNRDKCVGHAPSVHWSHKTSYVHNIIGICICIYFMSTNNSSFVFTVEKAGRSFQIIDHRGYLVLLNKLHSILKTFVPVFFNFSFIRIIHSLLCFRLLCVLKHCVYSRNFRITFNYLNISLAHDIKSLEWSRPNSWDRSSHKAKTSPGSRKYIDFPILLLDASWTRKKTSCSIVTNTNETHMIFVTNTW